MNTIDFTETGGFPLDQGVLGFLQDSTLLAAKAAAWGGNLSIISDCIIAGANAGNGFVSINGEILPFLGGAIDAKVIIMETPTSLLYEDNVSRSVKKVRYATFGDDGVTNYLWASFKRNTAEGVLARLDRLERVAAPFLAVGKGGMVMWNRAANLIPTGWQEVIDWRGRLPMGVDLSDPDFDSIEKNGGAKGVKMTLGNLIAHVHTFIKGQTQGAGAVGGYVYGASQGNASKDTESTGSADPTPINVLNPFRTVYFIELIDQS